MKNAAPLIEASTEIRASWATTCRDCGNYLTATEEHYYENRCNECEGRWLDRIESWRHGGEDDDLDALYG